MSLLNGSFSVESVAQHCLVLSGIISFGWVGSSPWKEVKLDGVVLGGCNIGKYEVSR